jgi:iron(III) transport system ATP-binding protein
MNQLEITNLSHAFKKKKVLTDISFNLAQGEILVVLGASGCGKSTLLNCLAGFEPIKQGMIKLNQTVVDGHNSFIMPQKRNIGLVLQETVLFPHLTVKENILLGINQSSLDYQESQLNKYITLLNIEDKLSAYPHELSGGQARRVSIARALCLNPQLLLMDEAFNGLDPMLSRSLRVELKKILKNSKLSTIIVTHDQAEALDLADRILLLNQGKIEQLAHPHQLILKPASDYVAEFMAQYPFLIIKKLNSSTCQQLAIDETFEKVFIPAQAIYYSEEGVRVELTSHHYYGTHYEVWIKLDGQALHFHLNQRELDFFLQQPRIKLELDQLFYQ